MRKEPIVTFPRWGNCTVVFKNFFEELGLKVISPEKTTSKTISDGAKISPDMYCFPLKVTLGNYLPALKKGANTIIMIANAGGSCRQRYYGDIQKKALLDNHIEVNFVTLRLTPKGIYTSVKELSNASSAMIIKAAKSFLQRLRFIENLEKKASYLRPRESRKGETDKILQESFLKLENTSGNKDFLKLKKETFKKISEIKIDKNKNVLRVGLVGEIYTVCDPTINFNIEQKLGEEGIEVFREMNISYHLKKGIFPWKDKKIQKEIMPHLKSTVGGHGRDAIYEMMRYIREDFDGVIQLLPFGCMPETTIRPILEKLHKESGIPFLSLSIDEQVAEAGINTRIEAFVDVAKNYNEKKKK